MGKESKDWEGKDRRTKNRMMRRGRAEKLSKETLGKDGQGFGDIREGMEKEMRGRGGRGPRA